MKVLRVFNNNVVHAIDDAGGEIILTGRGLGYQARPGQEVDRSKIVRTFVPSDGRDSDQLANLLSGIPPEHIALLTEAMSAAGLDTRALNSPTLVIALADHIGFALRRLDLELAFDYPLLGEVQNLYPDEYRQSVALLAAINARLERTLPEGEAVALALHIVNAGFTTGDLSDTYTMTGVIQQMVEVIGQTVSFPLDMGSVSVGRFVTHMRYLFVRIHQHRQLAEEATAIGEAIRTAYPRDLECAERLAAIVELRLGEPLTADEISYLTLHVARVTSDQP